eukprot:762731-Hanusia_phi.AAC.2
MRLTRSSAERIDHAIRSRSESCGLTDAKISWEACPRSRHVVEEPGAVVRLVQRLHFQRLKHRVHGKSEAGQRHPVDQAVQEHVLQDDVVDHDHDRSDALDRKQQQKAQEGDQHCRRRQLQRIRGLVSGHVDGDGPDQE